LINITGKTKISILTVSIVCIYRLHSNLLIELSYKSDHGMGGIKMKKYILSCRMSSMY